MTNNDYSQRKPTRIPDYDYSRHGGYFVTICTQDRKHLFGHVDADGVIHCNQYGEIVWDCWRNLTDHYDNIQLDEFVVMPNHVHGIIFMIDTSDLGDTKREGLKPSPTDKKRHGLTEIVRALKTFSARRINEKRGLTGVAVWQRSFHGRVIRNDAELNQLREYVQHNPSLWAEDRYYSF